MIVLGDCLEKLKELEDNSIDSIVTDPPYGISFMGKKWDYDVPKVEVWQECLRVLKPGGHALVACGTRTQHRMAVNLEDAGFEIRDIVAWIYGSGFPKSHNIGKAVDKLQGNEREVLGTRQVPDQRSGGISSERTAEKGGVPTRETTDTKGSSPHEGWGTALKPAMELWTLCRKPLEEKTIASNVLKYGTGGINIDGCRVGTDENLGRPQAKNSETNPFSKGLKSNGYNDNSNGGRFPANLLHDGSDEVVEGFPASKGDKRKTFNDSNGSEMFGGGISTQENRHNDSGSASRFFKQCSFELGEGNRFKYQSKASKSERNKGLEGFEEKGKVFNGQSAKPSKEVKDVEERFNTKPTKNFHPTVKPIKLMQYLCRLITPKGGTILDPYMGSGSTGIGAKLEGFKFIGIEREEDYCKIAEARINSRQPKTKML